MKAGKKAKLFLEILAKALEMDKDEIFPFDGVTIENFNGATCILGNKKYLELFSATFQKFISIKRNEKDWVDSFNNDFGLIKSNMSTLVKSYYSGAQYHYFEQFGRSDILFSHLAIDFHYSQKLKDPRITTICIITERGKRLLKLKRFLLERFYSLIEKKGNGSTQNNNIQPINLFIILNVERDVFQMNNLEREMYYNELSKDFKNELFDGVTGKFNGYVNLNFSFLPVGYHNHHITLFLNQNLLIPDKIEEFSKDDQISISDLGIYYNQDGYNSIVSPIRVVLPRNIKSLLKKFVSEWLKAKSIKEKGVYDGI